jgi:hypothetical protein
MASDTPTVKTNGYGTLHIVRTGLVAALENVAYGKQAHAPFMASVIFASRAAGEHDLPALHRGISASRLADAYVISRIAALHGPFYTTGAD